jgi:hypothetical protein
MSSTSKRVASSPVEKMNQKKRVEANTAIQPTPTTAAPSTSAAAVDAKSGSIFKFEVVSINDAKYYGVLSEPEIIHIWEKLLGRSREEIYAMTYSRSLTRNFRVTFKLHASVEPSELFPEPTFEHVRPKPGATREDEVDVLVCRIIGHGAVKPAELGQLTRVTVKTNEFTVTPDQIVEWLVKFGSVSSIRDYERNTLGIRTDLFETELVLKRHIPEYLPIAGRKVVVSYPGIPKVCNNCYEPGHMKRACRAKRVEWIDKVKEFRDSEEITDEMLGDWVAIIEREK